MARPAVRLVLLRTGAAQAVTPARGSGRSAFMMTAFKTFTLLVVLAGWALLVVGCSRKDSAEEPATGAAPTATGTSASGDFAAAWTGGMSHRTLKFANEERTFRVYIPFGLKDDSKAPLVVALHGGLGSGDQFATTSRFERLAQDEGFVVVFPDGIGATWNAGGCCGQASRTNIDDVGFLKALIELVEREAPVDPARVFMTGHSNGAMMAFRFGCEHPELVRGIAPVAGSLEIPGCKASKGTNLLAIHGDADQNHPIDGGQGPRSIAGVDFTSMAKTLSLWTSAMGCGAPQAAVSGPLTTTDWKNCKDGTIARYIVIAGADHPWPGGLPSVLGNATQDLDATKTVWEFFKGL